jgi:hypothetical protein
MSPLWVYVDRGNRDLQPAFGGVIYVASGRISTDRNEVKELSRKFGNEEFQITYQNNLDVIQELKDKAWKATHYSVLGQAAIYALYTSKGLPSCHEYYLFIFSLVTALWASLLIGHLQGRLFSRRARLKVLRNTSKDECISPSFEKVWCSLTKSDLCKFEKPIGRWKNDYFILMAYITVIWGPGLIVLVHLFF